MSHKSEISNDISLLRAIIATTCEKELMLDLAYRQKLTSLFRSIDTERVSSEAKPWNNLAKLLINFINEYPQVLEKDFDPMVLLKGVKNTENAHIIEYFSGKLNERERTPVPVLDRINSALNKDLHFNAVLDDLDEIDALRDLVNDELGSKEYQVVLDQILKKVGKMHEGISRKNAKLKRKGITFDKRTKTARGLGSAMHKHRAKSDLRIYLSSGLRHFFPKGLLLSTLNVFCSIGGGGKSVILIDVIADILFSNLNNHILESSLLGDKSPMILYISRELSESQVLARILSAQGYDQDILLTKSEEELAAIFFEHTKDSPFSLHIHCTEAKSEGYEELKHMIGEFEREGLKTIMVVDDYLDLAKYEPSAEDDKAKDAPIVTKARHLRNLAKNDSTPFFALTAAQILGQAVNDFNKYKGVDKIKAWNLSHLQGSAKLQQEVEILCAVHYDKKDRIMSVHNLKDRDGNIQGDLDLLVIPMLPDKFKLGAEHKTSLADYKPESASLLDIISTTMQVVGDDALEEGDYGYSDNENEEE